LREALTNEAWDMVLCDGAPDGLDGESALLCLAESGLELPIIVVSHAATQEAVLAAMRCGARDYILKGDLAPMSASVERELARRGQRLAAAAALEQSRARVATLEEHLQRAHRMESMGRVAGAIAHDFNNLLTVIGTSAEFLLERLPSSHALYADVRNISSSAQQGAELVRQLLAFSQRQSLRPKAVDMNAKLQGMLRLIARTLGDSIELLVRPAPDIPRVKVDPAKLEQVLLNLIVNARDAMPEGGTLSMELEELELDEAATNADFDLPRGRYVRLSVIDTGIGMTEEVKNRAFEPFFTTKEHGRGTGLGLASVYGIVTHSGGAIGVQSELGRGTRFDVYLPAQEEHAPLHEHSSLASTQRAAGSETILLVDDEEFVRRAAARVLRAAGYTVLEANNGAEAIALCERFEGSIDLLLTDMMMPGITGAQLAVWLRLTRSSARVLFTSGSLPAPNAGERHETSADILPKPFSTALLLDKVRSALDSI
jgi:signal transduction histidine kinase